MAAEVVNAAFADGRLNAAEHGERLQSLLEAKTLGAIVPLLSDITLPSKPAAPARRSPLRSGALMSWLGLALLLNVIWVATWLVAGNPPYYYWPIWPMIGTAVPAIIGYFSPGQRPDADGDSSQRQLGDGR